MATLDSNNPEIYSSLRPAAVAGMFYPDDADQLRKAIGTYMDEVDDHVRLRADRFAAEHPDQPFAKAIIAPHAGYIYSAPVAASAYSFLRSGRGRIKQVVIMGPAHRVGFPGIAAPTSDVFANPWADVPVNQQTITTLCELPQVHRFEQAHSPEHCLEVQLPFLLHLLQDPGPHTTSDKCSFTIVPLLFGQAQSDEVAEVFAKLWDRQDTVFIVSSDLSHYMDYDSAQRRDKATARAIEQDQPHRLGPDRACGHTAIAGLMAVAKHHGLRAHNVDLRNSGDTPGSPGPADKVVGYGAFIFF